jgi:tRNA (adenine57-N1/adenine58-N1)-methyltransferase
MVKFLNQLIQENDFVVLYSSPQEMKQIQVKSGEIYRNRRGDFDVSSFVGKPFGTKHSSINQQGFIYLLYPTPELWTLCLPHRTQIVYQPDISLVTMMLELVPGTNMIEAGTGSGSFTHSISRTIGHGQLYTFEYHKERQQQAEKEFISHGLFNVISQHRDVCVDGFGLINQVQAGIL